MTPTATLPRALDVYSRGAARPAGRPAVAPEAAPTAAPAAPAAAAPARPALRTAVAADLSADERGMIARYFPERPALALQLYGPSGARAVTPEAVGQRLDLRG